MKRTPLVLAAAIGVACGNDDRPPQRTPAPPEQPRRTAAEADDLRHMVTELVAARACERIEGTFRPLGGKDSGGPVSGSAWITGCRASKRGDELRLEIEGRAWQWVDRETEKAQATFSVQHYVPFAFTLKTAGELDVAYARDAHVFTLWFTPAGRPGLQVEPIGDVEVDAEGVWSSVVGGVATLFASSPEERAGDKVSAEGKDQLATLLAKGLAATVDLCTGKVRTGFGHPPAGDMLGTKRDERTERAVLHPGGVLLRGPLPIRPTDIALDVPAGGAVTSQLVCVEHAEKLARAVIAGAALPAVPTIASKEVRGKTKLEVPAGGCPPVHVLRPLANAAGPVEVRYSAMQIVADLEPLARCDREAKR